VRIQRILLFILLTATFGFADGKKVSHDLDKVNPGQKVNVVIRYKHQPQPALLNSYYVAGENGQP
jgi:hypothetical protein